uniref:Histidine biosynthesis bifunctional protein HisIE n=1 Tax=Paulinella chromatophora TaxID=39717 RepID=B1X3F5_PAUCH|nr:histidine biosynthesis bifunctional protein HisIE [Paulinella chromatophora]ACB42474.1 histidine biosynthesis bifunctional protein HisIE [Paulinella chromatophora]
MVKSDFLSNSLTDNNKLKFTELSSKNVHILNIEKLQFDQNGLILGVVQDWLDGTILMVAWMNREAIEITMITGQGHYWSRSRKKLWHKGGTSGHFQIVKGIRHDCDADVLLISVEQQGDIACHTGTRSCFSSNNYELTATKNYTARADVCTELAKTIVQRRNFPETGSYTNKLLEGGDNRILKKIGEESVEFVMACKDKNNDDIIGEAADLIFHIQVALAHHQVKWHDVLRTLSDRREVKRRLW